MTSDQTSHIRPNAQPRAIVIAASTGGPQAVQKICAGIARRISSVPILIVQHMPEGFAGIVAAQLQRTTGLAATASQDGLAVRGGHIYVANSGSHLKLERRGLAIHLRQDDHDAINYCKPSADVLFTSAASIYRNNLIGIVLSGMGVDGLNGSRAIAAAGGILFAQDEDTSAVWGMPGALARSEVHCDILAPDDIVRKLRLLLGAKELSPA